MQFIKLLTELTRGDLAIAGGKGANLGALIQARLPVPPGFCISTNAYRFFVETNGLEAELRPILQATQMDDPVSLEAASESIRACFGRGKMPPALADEIRGAYAALTPSHHPKGFNGRHPHPLAPSPAAGEGEQTENLGVMGGKTAHNTQIFGTSPLKGGWEMVAVRSSATAEDLPDLSFAGQQDTYLNILGEDSLLDAVIRCWASLWTARAIGYRARNQIDQAAVALAVVVQQMVQSEASGVLFTVNPLTGRRSETVIDATLGLGEALVSGQVEPDHYVVECGGGEKILSKTLGAKALSIQGQAGGGTITIHHSAASQQALPDEQILALVRLGQQAQAYFGGPQDMEWAWADGRLYVVQSRPVTSLYPLPAGVKAETFEVLLSFGVWQGMLDPYTPIGQDVFATLVAGMGKLFGVEVKADEQRVFLPAGERLFVNITGLLKNPIGRAVAELFISAIDPVSKAILVEVLKDPHLATEQKISFGGRLRLLRGVAPLVGNVLFNIIGPARGRARLERQIEAALADAQKACTTAYHLPELIENIEAVAARMPRQMLPRLVGGIAAGQAPFQILLRQAAAIPGGPELTMELTRGLPHNVTTEMDLALWRTSQAIRADSSAAAHFSQTEIETLVAEYRQNQLPAAAQAAIGQFLAVYGMRGVGEIDLGRPRWREEPQSIFQVLKSYLEIAPEASPEAMFQRGAEKAEQAREQLVEAFQKTGGWPKKQMAKGMTRRVRELGGLRETPKFFIVRMLGHIRQALLAAGQPLAAAGRLAEAEDVLFLHLGELKALGNGENRDWKALVAERRATYARELRRRQIPRIMLSDGTALYEAPASSVGGDGNALSGSPVSAGVVEGTVRVVLDPHGVQLIPGEILVCPATDPAWTPLFLAAGGLVMEVGGMMTHGSVVAREYGIPAVVGVSQATTRLQTGQRVRVDGGRGVVELLD
jgi:pyruvate,water dikinase